MELRITYAQNREDIILSGFFPDVTDGHYVDIGAGHPTDLSVTKYFYERGWSGINVEPIPELAELLRTERPRDTTVQAGVGAEPGTATFRQYAGSGLSSFNEAIIAQHAAEPIDATADFTDYEITVTTLRAILRDHPLPHLHFLKVDVEGSEFDVLAGNDWEEFRPEVLCIETDHVVRDWIPLVEAARYHHVFHDGLNAYYVAEESRHRAELFRFSTVVLQGGALVGPEVAAEVAAAPQLRNEKWELEKQVSGLLEELTRLQREQAANLTRHQAELADELTRHQAELAELHAAHLQREAFVTARLVEQEAYLTEVLSSTSWRITRPMRRFGDLLRASLPRPMVGRLQELRDRRRLRDAGPVQQDALSPDAHLVLEDLELLAEDST